MAINAPACMEIQHIENASEMLKATSTNPPSLLLSLPEELLLEILSYSSAPSLAMMRAVNTEMHAFIDAHLDTIIKCNSKMHQGRLQRARESLNFEKRFREGTPTFMECLTAWDRTYGLSNLNIKSGGFQMLRNHFMMHYFEAQRLIFAKVFNTPKQHVSRLPEMVHLYVEFSNLVQKIFECDQFVRAAGPDISNRLRPDRIGQGWQLSGVDRVFKEVLFRHPFGRHKPERRNLDTFDLMALEHGEDSPVYVAEPNLRVGLGLFNEPIRAIGLQNLFPGRSQHLVHVFSDQRLAKLYLNTFWDPHYSAKFIELSKNKLFVLWMLQEARPMHADTWNFLTPYLQAALWRRFPDRFRLQVQV